MLAAWRLAEGVAVDGAEFFGGDEVEGGVDAEAFFEFVCVEEVAAEAERDGEHALLIWCDLYFFKQGGLNGFGGEGWVGDGVGEEVFEPFGFVGDGLFVVESCVAEDGFFGRGVEVAQGLRNGDAWFGEEYGEFGLGHELS